MTMIDWAERGILPDWMIRMGIRRLLTRRLAAETSKAEGDPRSKKCDFFEELRCQPVAIETAAANEQHYEVPAEFFHRVLGSRLKYSSAWFDTPTTSLDEAEESMLLKTCQRAELEDGMKILELGCGWGSLTLWMAEHYPNASITAVSNSNSQREWIESICRERGFDNVVVRTADMRDFDAGCDDFDRVVSVEMFEHMRNYEQLLHRISSWLKPDGKLFVHIFCHRDLAYAFECDGDNDWMARHFFTGGIMPSEDLLLHFPKHLTLEHQWTVDGMHYYYTCEGWLRKLDADRERLLELFNKDLGPRESAVQLQRWRMFFMACGELFRFRGGNEWFVTHCLLQNTRRPQPEDEGPESRASYRPTADVVLR